MVITLNRKIEKDGLRPLKPSRDLCGVADLIEEAFARELDQAGRTALRDMRMMGRWGFLFGWLDYFSPDVNTHLNGFVWLEQGRIVGNVTVSRNAPGSKHWFISNVAVSQLYRKRGIARALMTAALEYVREMRGYVVSLHVNQGNQPAIQLYQSLGFKHISATSYLKLDRIRDQPHIPLPDGVKMRAHRLDIQDATAAYALAKETVSDNIQVERPLRQSQFRLGSEIIFSNFWRRLIGLGESKHYVVESTDGKFVATLGIIAGSWWKPHKLTLTIHPDWWGHLEKPLISFALTYLKSCPGQTISFQHPAEHQAGISAFEEFNFTIQRTHIWMKLAIES